jgi:hypothetical protein
LVLLAIQEYISELHRIASVQPSNLQVHLGAVAVNPSISSPQKSGKKNNNNNNNKQDNSRKGQATAGSSQKLPAYVDPDTKICNNDKVGNSSNPQSPRHCDKYTTKVPGCPGLHPIQDEEKKNTRELHDKREQVSIASYIKRMPTSDTTGSFDITTPAGSSSFGMSTIRDSVVSKRDATDAALPKAVLTTLAGSMMPDLIMSTYLSVFAS